MAGSERGGVKAKDKGTGDKTKKLPANFPVRFDKEQFDTQEKRDFYLPRVLAVLIGIFIIGLLAVFYVARDFLVPVTLAFLIAITFRPLIRWLSVRGLPAWASASALATTVLVVGLSVGYLISGPVAGWIADAPEIRRSLTEKVRSISGTFDNITKITEDIKDAATPLNDKPVTEVVVKEPGLPAIFSMAAYPVSYVATFTGAVILSLFLMASGDLLYEKLINIMPTLTDKKNALRVVQDVETEVSTYLLLHSAINAAVGLAIASLFYLIGMPSIFLWAIVAFILNFIPYAGPVAGASMAALAGLLVFDTLGSALLAPALYTAVVTIENQFISPYILRKRLQLNSVAILLSIAFWGWIWGISGIVLAVPLLVTLKVFSSHFESLTNVGEFLSESADNKVADSSEQAIEVRDSKSGSPISRTLPPARHTSRTLPSELV
jgi:predicted PurR-regulated permease PerM